MKRPEALRLALGCTLLGWVLALSLAFAPLWRPAEYTLFDLYTIYTAPGPPELPIRIVAIDDYSLQQLDLPWPWPRRVYAELVDRLAAAGASVIAFDMQFSEPSNAEDDTLFAQAIGNAGNVVLASRFDMQRTPLGTIRSNLDPLVALTEAGATIGHTDMDLAEDQIPRQIAEDQLVNEAPRPPLWREAVLMLIRVCGGCVDEPGFPPGSMIRYLGPSHSFAYFPVHEVLSEEPEALAEYLQDAIVFIGWDAGAGTDLAAQDAFPTPFTRTTRQLTPGVEIHATQLANVMLNTMIEPATRQQNLLLASGALLLMLPLLAWWHPLRSGVLALALMAGLLGLAFWCFRDKQLWLAGAAPLAGMTLAFVANGTGAFLTERRRAAQIRGAFAMYVSEDVVKEMIAHPERLTLGGQRREISVLFCDLAGFTQLSESLAPEAVGRVVNHYLTAMTEVVMRHGGTVDKFIGDAVMAFWGAPLDDPQHAEHALAAALAMHQAMQDLQSQFEALGAPNLRLRVGINSGPAIVGNMGSDKRFDYTAIGDSVNLASRLEGANKAYGTPILIAESTRVLLGERCTLRQVDRVRVKGKQQPVAVFTPCSDAALAALDARVWAAFIARDWEAARARLAMLRELAPSDALAEQMAQRIDACAQATLPADWDGSTALDKL